MKALSIVLGVIVLLSAGAGGYLYQNNYQPLQQDVTKLESENSQLQNKLSQLEAELNQKVLEITNTKKEKEAEIARIQSTKDSLITEMQNEIEDNQIQITQLADKLKVSIVDKILFPPGEADIASDGLAVLERVGNILKNQKNKIIRVEGHTDNVPIQGKLKERFDSNWELSNARATNVVRFLEETVGIDPTRLEAVGLGEHHPVASNETKETRAQNRRIEIALLPIK